LINTGIVIIDKPKGPTSHQVADYVKKILNLNKAGHTGTLDPGVSGVLPIALEDSTRVVQVLLPAGKEYVALAHFHKQDDEEILRKEFKKFVGKIKQLPPVKSAVKRQERERTIYYIDIIEINGKDVLFRVGCQGGTYIRKLIHDIGKNIGGAHMAELIRTKAGPFTDKDMINLNDLSDAFYYYEKDGNEKYLRHCIKPLESAIQHLPKIYVLDTAIDSLSHGANLKLPGISKFENCIKKKDLVAILSLKGELISIGYSCLNSKNILEKDKGIAVKTFKIFMNPGVYPKVPKKE
jgi:H/ACA ribonucleoprotein complex subunit 4